MATALPPTQTKQANPDSFSKRVDRFWKRVTEGMELGELWTQFRTDARSSYRLYSKDVDATRDVNVGRGRHALNVAGQYFWAIVEKLVARASRSAAGRAGPDRDSQRRRYLAVEQW